MPLEHLQGQGDSPHKDIALTCLFDKETASLSLSFSFPNPANESMSRRQLDSDKGTDLF